jgi:hypothetical protein
MAIQGNSREFIARDSIQSRFDGPTAMLPWSSIRFLSRCNWELSDGNQIFGICEKSGVVGKPDVGGSSDYHVWFTDVSGSTVCCEGALQYTDFCDRSRPVIAGIATN